MTKKAKISIKIRIPEQIVTIPQPKEAPSHEDCLTDGEPP